MAGFNRFGGSSFGSLYPGIGGLGQSSASRREDRFDDRGRNGRGFERRDIDRDFGRRDPSPRRRRYSPDPSYSSMRGRRDDRGDLGSYSLDHIGGHNNFSSRGQRSSDSDYNRAGRNLGPPSRGDGILGAKPGDMPVGSNASSGGMNPQITQQQQQQQLMAMMQTQSLLAAIQAQASAASKAQPQSLLQGLRMNDRGMDRMNRKRRFSPIRGQMRNRNQQGNRQQDRRDQQSRFRMRQRNRHRNDRPNNQKRNDSGKKSDDEGPFEEPYVEENPDEEEEDEPEEEKEEPKEAEPAKQKPEEPKEKPVESAKEEIKNEEDTKSKDQDEDSTPKSSINLAGQNVDKLTRSLFDTFRRKYVCKVCKIMCTKEPCFRQHLFGRRHVKTWLESQGQSFEAVIFKKATEEAAKTLAASETSKPEATDTTKVNTEESAEKKDEQTAQSDSETAASVKVKEESVESNKESTPPLITESKPEIKEEKKEEKKLQVFDAKYSCDTRKMAVKDGEYITITSINEARVKINGFDTGLDTGGCEFVKAVSGFHCRLCKSFIQFGCDVMKHVKGRKHQANYRMYIREHPKYEANQKVRNKELDEMLSEREGETILLYEVSDDEEEVRQPSRYGARRETTITVKPIRYIAQDAQDADQSMDDKDDADANHQEDSQDNTTDNDKTMDEEEEEEKETQDHEDQDVHEPEEDPLEDDQGAVEDLLKETEEEEKINSEEIADISIEPEISLSDLANDVSNDEEPQMKKTKATPPSRRGRKQARGGGQGGRGRGRGRGTRKNTRQTLKAKAELSSDDHHSEDVDFMDGFEVIDEVNDEN